MSEVPEVSEVQAAVRAIQSEMRSVDRSAEIRRITEDYTLKVNALIEDHRDDLVADLEVQYMLDIQDAAPEPTPTAA